MSARLPAVDAYIAAAPAFAQPILHHLRSAVHSASPGVEEGVKWSRPFFSLEGIILANMAAFKAHCSFGLWGPEMSALLAAGSEPAGKPASESMGSFGRLTSLADLPRAPELEGYIRHAAELIRTGARTKSIQRVTKPGRGPLQVPPALSTALDRHPPAARAFAAMSPSCRREYAAWISEAKREDTRNRRVAEAIRLITEGKGRNWRYETTASKGNLQTSP